MHRHCHKCDKESDFFLQPNRVQDSSQTSSKHGRAIRLPEKFIPTDELPKKVTMHYVNHPQANVIWFTCHLILKLFFKQTPPQPGVKRKRVANGKSAGRKKVIFSEPDVNLSYLGSFYLGQW